MSEPMRLHLRAKAPVTEVHWALTEAGQLRTWLAEHAEVDLPSRYEFWGRHTPEGDVPRQRLLHVDDRGLRFAWDLDDEETIVDIRLEEEDAEHTLITLVQTELPHLQAAIAGEGSQAVMHTFWSLALANLVDHLEGRPLTPHCDFTSTNTQEQVTIHAPAKAVYDSLTDAETFSRWFGVRIAIDLRVGGHFAVGGLDLDPAPAEITDLEPGRLMRLRWDDGMDVKWELEGSNGATQLTISHSGSDEQPHYQSWLGWLAGIVELRRFHEVDDWQPMWLAVEMEGIPEEMTSY